MAPLTDYMAFSQTVTFPAGCPLWKLGGVNLTK